MVRARQSCRRSSAPVRPPERGGAAPARADVVFHEQTVLHHVGVGPDGLVGIFGQHAGSVFADAGGIGLDRGIYPHVVAASSPRRTVALCTANLREQLLAALYLGIVQVTGGRNCQATVPHHELIVLLVAHLLLAVVRLAVEQGCAVR